VDLFNKITRIFFPLRVSNITKMLVLLHGGMDDDDEGGFLKSESMIKLHASFELLGWALLLNLGTIFGRYMKRPPRANGILSSFPNH
jgi:hypothetical protein